MTISGAETVIIGGGVVGLSVACGLLRGGASVTVLDGVDRDLRASHGNFGLVWLQGKGAQYAPYAQWTCDAVAAWPGFATHLAELAGVDVALEQRGGFEFFTDAAELSACAADLATQKEIFGNSVSHEILSGDNLRRRVPGIGERVVGATWCPLDGHVNPLRLLRALRAAVVRLGGHLESGSRVERINPQSGGGFEARAADGRRHGAARVILCAGLGAARLGPQLGFGADIRPQRGELLITEKLGDRLPFLSSTIRQVDEGGVQIGGTKADAGPDDGETLDNIARLARHAVDVYPALAEVRVVRSWGALRVVTRDGYPVYQRSERYPGAYLVTCHSGITLAPLHATALADWIDAKAGAPDLEAFDENRITLSPAA